MSERAGQTKRGGARRSLGAILAVLTFVCQQASAQTPPLTSPSVSSLRNALAAGGLVQLHFTGTVTPSNPFVITVDNTVLDATGFVVTISGGNTTRIFDVPTNIHFTITNLILSGGNNIGAVGATGIPGADATTHSGQGGNGGTGGAGGNGLGGAIRNQGFCTLVDCILVSNVATGGAGGVGGNGGNSVNGTGGIGGAGGNGGTGLGGAIYNLGTVVLTNCTLAGNTATAGAGGAGGAAGTGTFPGYSGNGGVGAVGAGAGLYNLGTALIYDCTLNQNTAQGGSTQTAGGGLLGNGNGPNGRAGGDGQGGAIASLGTNVMVNCSFFENLVTAGAGGTGSVGNQYGGNGGNGGNAWGGSVYNAGTLSLTNCSFATSAALGGTNGAAGVGAINGQKGSVGASVGDLIANNGGTFNLRNSLLAYTIDGANPFRSTGVNSYGTIIDQGNNLSSDGTPAFTTTNSFHNLDPLLTPLDDNGGLTLTMALQPGSPAIDAIYDNSAPATDQRGFLRPFPLGLRSDIGAYEYGATTTGSQLGGMVMLGVMPFPNVTVTAGNASAVTDSNGHYSFFLPSGFNYVVSPAPSAYFNPPGTNVSLSTNNVTNLNFVATNSPATITINPSNHTSIQFGFSVIPTFSYRVQASTNLATNAWVNVATNVAVSNLLIYTDSTTNFPKRFFRTISP